MPLHISSSSQSSYCRSQKHVFNLYYVRSPWHTLHEVILFNVILTTAECSLVFILLHCLMQSSRTIFTGIISIIYASTPPAQMSIYGFTLLLLIFGTCCNAKIVSYLKFADEFFMELVEFRLNEDLIPHASYRYHTAKNNTTSSSLQNDTVMTCGCKHGGTGINGLGNKMNNSFADSLNNANNKMTNATTNTDSDTMVLIQRLAECRLVVPIWRDDLKTQHLLQQVM